MRYYQSHKYRDEIENMEAVLTLLNLRDATSQAVCRHSSNAVHGLMKNAASF